MSIPVLTELFYDGAWQDISDDVRVPAGVEITFGRSDSAATPEAAKLVLTIDNRGGTYSPRNPLSPLFKKIGRNTPIRVAMGGVTEFTGEVSAWPNRANLPGTDSFMPIEAAGILRRINQGDQSVTTGLEQFYRSTTPISYWALTDGPTAVKGAVTAGTFQGSSLFPAPNAGVVMEFGAGVLADHLTPVLRLNDTVEVGGPGGPSGYLTGLARGSDTTPDALAWEFTFRADPTVSGTGAEMGLLHLDANIEGSTLGTYDQWALEARRGADDDLSLSVILDSLGESPTVVALANTAPLAAIADGQLHHVRLQLEQNGADTDYEVYLDGSSVISGTRAGHTLRRSYGLSFSYDRAAATGLDFLALGHVIVWENLANIPAVADTFTAVSGFAGETAGRRIQRLCDELDIAFVPGTGVDADLDDSEPMGLQYGDYFSNQLAECEQTDMGLLGETRTGVALFYFTRRDLYNQTPLAIIDYDAGELSPPIDPVDDDQDTHNDVFAQRREGSSFQATVESGPLSIQQPPNGVGRYKDEYQVNVQTDARLEGIAWWRVSLGTVDAARFPQVSVNRANPAVAASVNDLLTTIKAVDVGEVIRILSGPKLRAAYGIYDDTDLLVVGGRVWTDGTEHIRTFNCVPYQPYVVARYQSSDSRYDTAGSELAAGISSSATTLSIASTAGTLWTTNVGGGFDLNVAGERMTVTAISGASSPQSATVIRSVNGVVKAHAAGADVRLWQPAKYAL